MSECRHTNLELLQTVKTDRLRCRHCHLTITAKELDGKHCPECHERDGSRNTDFEEVPSEADGPDGYRCEDCGILINP